MRIAIVDYETLPIHGRPDYPPPPVGVAIRVGGRSRYFAFGHLEGNKHTYEQAREALLAIWDDDGIEIVFHNAGFDLEVGRVHMGLPEIPWHRVHDTVPLLFLQDPRAESFSLKPSAERVLNLPPDEREEIEEWLLENQPLPKVKMSPSRKSPCYVGAYIAYAPVSMVAPYAIGDVDRTHKLFQALVPEIKKRGMWDAYQREMRLLPHLMEMERNGVPVNLEALKKAQRDGLRSLDTIDQWLYKRLNKGFPFNVDSGDQLAKSLVSAGVASEASLGITKTGKLRTAKDAIKNGVTDKGVSEILRYRSALAACMKTFISPWVSMAENSGGLIYTQWNSTRRGHGKERRGARTGRLSSNPNFQNITRNPATDYKLPIKLPPLPTVRGFVTAFAGERIIDRDYHSQEPRILGHFESGPLMQTYLDDPWTDFHNKAKAELSSLGLQYERKIVKAVNLGIIYGEGVGLLAVNTGLSVVETKYLKDAILSMYPGLRDMYRDMRRRAQGNLPIRTWGGREYYCEPPKWVDGKLKTFDYKLVNVLIQGSAADCTKEAIIRFCEAKKPTWRLILNVHDELVASVPKHDVKAAMRVMRETMDSVEFDVPILSEGKSGTDWAHLADYDKKGKLCTT